MAKTNKRITPAVLLRAGHVVASCDTTARGGATLAYGFERVRGGALLEVGWARVSRDRRHLGNDALMEALPLAIVNAGGGPDV